jgi:hypothetical protein
MTIYPRRDRLRTSASSTIYSDPEFHAHIQSLSARLPTYAESAHDQARDRAIDVIRTSVCDLWMVWQRAWERQEWPI